MTSICHHRSKTSTVFRWIATAILLAAATCNQALAAVVSYESFENYTAGVNLNNGSQGTGWTGNWATVGNHTTVQTTSLTDPNGTVAGGTKAARLQATANLADEANFMSRSFTSTSSNIYVGFLIRNAGGVDSTDFYNFQVSNGATGNATAALGVGIRNATGNPFFARVGSSSSGQTTNAGTNAALDTTFLLVAKFSKESSTTYNRVDLYINPGSSEPGSASATATSTVTGLTSLSLFSIRNFTPESGDTVFIDELRIGTTFADAIPEPSVMLLGLLGSLMLLSRRRR